jgi:hypothetical protein
MELSKELWICLMIISILVIGTITSKSFWSLVRKKKCPHCNGDKMVHFDDEGDGLWEKCEHCQ